MSVFFGKIKKLSTSQPCFKQEPSFICPERGNRDSLAPFYFICIWNDEGVGGWMWGCMCVHFLLFTFQLKLNSLLPIKKPSALSIKVAAFYLVKILSCRHRRYSSFPHLNRYVRLWCTAKPDRFDSVSVHSVVLKELFHPYVICNNTAIKYRAC